MDESKKRTAMLRAKREFLEKAIPPGFFRSNDEDIKMIGVSSIDSLFSNIKVDEKGTKEDSTLSIRRPHNLEGENLIDFLECLACWMKSVPVDFIVLDTECNPPCPIILGRPL